MTWSSFWKTCFSLFFLLIALCLWQLSLVGHFVCHLQSKQYQRIVLKVFDRWRVVHHFLQLNSSHLDLRQERPLVLVTRFRLLHKVRGGGTKRRLFAFGDCLQLLAALHPELLLLVEWLGHLLVFGIKLLCNFAVMPKGLFVSTKLDPGQQAQDLLLAHEEHLFRINLQHGRRAAVILIEVRIVFPLVFGMMDLLDRQHSHFWCAWLPQKFHLVGHILELLVHAPWQPRNARHEEQGNSSKNSKHSHHRPLSLDLENNQLASCKNMNWTRHNKTNIDQHMQQHASASWVATLSLHKNYRRRFCPSTVLDTSQKKRSTGHILRIE